jgi:hypothetical protein
MRQLAAWSDKEGDYASALVTASPVPNYQQGDLALTGGQSWQQELQILAGASVPHWRPFWLYS